MLANERGSSESILYLIACIAVPCTIILFAAVLFSFIDAISALFLLLVTLSGAIGATFLNALLSFIILKLLDGKAGFMQTMRGHIYASTLSQILSAPVGFSILISMIGLNQFIWSSDSASAAIAGIFLLFPIGVWAVSFANIVRGMAKLHKVRMFIAILSAAPMPIMTMMLFIVLGILLFIFAIFSSIGFHGPGMY